MYNRRSTAAIDLLSAKRTHIPKSVNKQRILSNSGYNVDFSMFAHPESHKGEGTNSNSPAGGGS